MLLTFQGGVARRPSSGGIFSNLFIFKLLAIIAEKECENRLIFDTASPKLSDFFSDDTPTTVKNQ